jgi:hypothetical protein
MRFEGVKSDGKGRGRFVMGGRVLKHLGKWRLSWGSIIVKFERVKRRFVMGGRFLRRLGNEGKSRLRGAQLL